jgi:aminoglycoside 6'-N-acetyltransferase
MADDDAVIVEDGNLRLRLMRDGDDEYARLVAWRNQPHVREWWDPDDPPLTVPQAVADYRPSVTGSAPERTAVIEVDRVPVGFVQFYPWAPFADELAQMELTVPDGSWSLDIAIGDLAWISRGIGSRTVRTLCDHLFAREGATAVAFGVDRDNTRARRAYVKAGMTPTVEYLDLDRRNGERIWAVLMLRFAGS